MDFSLMAATTRRGVPDRRLMAGGGLSRLTPLKQSFSIGEEDEDDQDDDSCSSCSSSSSKSGKTSEEEDEQTHKQMRPMCDGCLVQATQTKYYAVVGYRHHEGIQTGSETQSKNWSRRVHSSIQEDSTFHDRFEKYKTRHVSNPGTVKISRNFNIPIQNEKLLRTLEYQKDLNREFDIKLTLPNQKGVHETSKVDEAGSSNGSGVGSAGADDNKNLNDKRVSFRKSVFVATVSSYLNVNLNKKESSSNSNSSSSSNNSMPLAEKQKYNEMIHELRKCQLCATKSFFCASCQKKYVQPFFQGLNDEGIQARFNIELSKPNMEELRKYQNEVDERTVLTLGVCHAQRDYLSSIFETRTAEFERSNIRRPCHQVAVDLTCPKQN